MKESTSAIRKAIVDGAGTHRIMDRIITHAQKQFGDNWIGIAILQASTLFKLNLRNARALVSEHCVVTTYRGG